MGSPVALLVLFVCLAIIAALLILPAFRNVPGFEKKICSHCEASNHYKTTNCDKCGKPLKVADDHPSSRGKEGL